MNLLLKSWYRKYIFVVWQIHNITTTTSVPVLQSRGGVHKTKMWADEDGYAEIAQLPPEVLKAIEQVLVPIKIHIRIRNERRQLETDETAVVWDYFNFMLYCRFCLAMTLWINQISTW
jgi:hypothetical protein